MEESTPQRAAGAAKERVHFRLEYTVLDLWLTPSNEHSKLSA
jgi:hypothetical protein